MLKHVVTFLFAFCIFSIPGCALYKAEIYVHQATHVFSDAMVNWRYKNADKYIDSTNTPIVVIPRFREFSKNFHSNYAFVYFVSKAPGAEVHVHSVSITSKNRDTESEIIDKVLKTKMVMTESPIQGTKKTIDYPFAKFRLFSSDSAGIQASDWNFEDVLIFTVMYSINGGTMNTQEFVLKKKTYTGIQMP